MPRYIFDDSEAFHLTRCPIRVNRMDQIRVDRVALLTDPNPRNPRIGRSREGPVKRLPVHVRI